MYFFRQLETWGYFLVFDPPSSPILCVCHIWKSLCTSSTADPPSFVPPTLPSFPNSSGLIFSPSLPPSSLSLSSSRLLLPFAPFVLGLAREGLIAQQYPMRAIAYRVLAPTGLHPEARSYLLCASRMSRTSWQNPVGPPCCGYQSVPICQSSRRIGCVISI